MLYIGSDHRGFALKEKIVFFLKRKNVEFADFSCDSCSPEDDYPDIAKRVSLEVAKDPGNRGILLCGSGVGVCIAANKINGIRAGAGCSSKVIIAAREQDDINVLCFSADTTSFFKAKKIIKDFLEIKFIPEDRYKRRIVKISALEKQQ